MPTSWPILKTVLERSLATPNTAAGHAVAEQDRPITLMINAARLPLAAPMPDPPGDSVLSFTAACGAAPVEPGTPSRCVLVANRPAGSEAAGVRYFQVRVGIVGLVAPDTGDFAQ